MTVTHRVWNRVYILRVGSGIGYEKSYFFHIGLKWSKGFQDWVALPPKNIVSTLSSWGIGIRPGGGGMCRPEGYHFQAYFLVWNRV